MGGMRMAGAAFCGNRQLYRMCGGVDWSYSPFCSAATIKPLPFTPDLRRHCWHHAWALQWAAHCRTTQCPRTGAAFTMVSHSRCATPPVRPAQSPVYVLQGSFGCVYKGTWHGKVVAIKIVNYSAAYLLQASGAAAEGAQQAGAGAAARGGGGGGGRVGHTHPQLALMEAALAGHMQHPNVVQVGPQQEQACLVSMFQVATDSWVQQVPAT